MEFFFTVQQCKDAANTLEKAKKHLWTGTLDEMPTDYDKFEEYRSEYICDCIRHVDDTAISQFLTDWIKHQLSNEFGLLEWLCNEHEIPLQEYHDYLSDEEFLKLQRTRLAWIEWMQQELEAKALCLEAAK